MSAASSTVSTSASPTAPTTTRDSDEASAVRAARLRATTRFALTPHPGHLRRLGRRHHHLHRPAPGAAPSASPVTANRSTATPPSAGTPPSIVSTWEARPSSPARRRRQLGAAAWLDRGPPRRQPDRAVRILGSVVPEEGGEGSATVSADRRWTSPCRNRRSDRPDCALQPDADCRPRINHDRSPH